MGISNCARAWRLSQKREIKPRGSRVGREEGGEGEVTDTEDYEAKMGYSETTVRFERGSRADAGDG